MSSERENDMPGLPPGARRYLTTGLESTPTVLNYLLSGFAADNPIWDFRPDPDRFTLREMMAHLADWEPIWLDRMRRTAMEREPRLVSYDEGEMAIERDYAHIDPVASLARFQAGREELVGFLRALDHSEWERFGIREELGPISISGQATLILGHDGYHTRQAIEWIEAARA
jgi:hypothetical protein